MCRESYTENLLRDYLVSFYSPQGGVEFQYLQDQDYILIECKKCELIYQKEIPNDLLMQKLYEEWIDPAKAFELFEKNRSIEYFSEISSEIIEVVSYFGQPPSQLDFLDFSMGWGNWCRVAQAFGCRVHGTEFSTARVDYAKRTGIEVVLFDELSKFKYDFINTEQIFEHLPDPQETISYLKECLKKDGILKISVPNGWDVKERLGRWNWEAPKGTPDSLSPVAPLEHVNCFNNKSLVAFARNSGFDIVEISETSSRNPTQNIPKKDAIKAMIRPHYRRLKELIRPTPKAPRSTKLMFRAVS
jgi:2-polyprenyl-3-methyl-5-hydroxy-6-metoxy-1,4-benzoquinol methylase